MVATPFAPHGVVDAVAHLEAAAGGLQGAVGALSGMESMGHRYWLRAVLRTVGKSLEELQRVQRRLVDPDAWAAELVGGGL